MNLLHRLGLNAKPGKIGPLSPNTVAISLVGPSDKELYSQIRDAKLLRPTCGRRLLHRLGPDASLGQVLVHQVQQHGGHIVLAALVPVAVHGQPVAQIPRLLPCIAQQPASIPAG